MSAAVSRRTALRGSLAASLGLTTGVSSDLRIPAPDAALIVQAEHFRIVTARERQAWGDLPDSDWESPAIAVCQALEQACRDAGEALAAMPARTPAGLAAKASAMLSLVGPRLDTQSNLAEHHLLVASILRDAAHLGGGSHV